MKPFSIAGPLLILLSLRNVISKIPSVRIIENRFECEVSDQDLSVRVKCPFVKNYCFENCLAIITCEGDQAEKCIPRRISDSCRIIKEGGMKKISLAIDVNDERSTGDWQCEQRGLRSKRIHFASISRYDESVPVSTEEHAETKEVTTTTTIAPQVQNPSTLLPMTSTTTKKNMAVDAYDSNPIEQVARNEEKRDNTGPLGRLVKFLTRFDVVIPIIVLLAVSLLINVIVSIRWCMNQSYKIQQKSDRKSHWLKLCLCKDEVQDDSLMKNSVFVSPKSFFQNEGNISYHEGNFDLRFPLLQDPNQMNRIQGMGTLRGVQLRPYESLRVGNSLNNATSQPVLLLSPMVSQRNEHLSNSSRSQNLFNAFEAKRNFFRKPLEQEENKINYPTYDDIASTSTSHKRNEQNNEEYYVEENSKEPSPRQKESSDDANTSIYKKNPAMVPRRKLIGDDDSGIEKRMTPYWIERGDNGDETRLHETISDPSNLLDKADFLLQEADKLITKKYFN